MKELETLQEVRNLDPIDQPLTVVGVRAWSLLAFFLLLLTAIVIWAFVGSIPIEIAGRAIIFDPQSIVDVRAPSTGIIQEQEVAIGQFVQKGDPLIVFENGMIVKAPISGKVVSVMGFLRQEVQANSVLLWIEGDYHPDQLKIFAFFPLHEGQQVQEGMAVNLQLDALPTQYGRIRGEVIYVLPFPIGLEEFDMQKIPSQALRKYFLEGEVPKFLVIIKPSLDPLTPSGLLWTSEFGPPEHISSGAVGEAYVLLEKRKPITYVIPSWGSDVVE